MVTRNKNLTRKFYYSIIECSDVVNLCTTLTIHNKPLFVEIISKCNWLTFDPGCTHYPLNPRMYYFLRTCRTTNELSVFIFVANIIHLAKMNSSSPFKTYQTSIWIIRLNMVYSLNKDHPFWDCNIHVIRRIIH